MEDMKRTVQARLDEDAQADLERLVKRLGWSPSKVVRESLRMMSACYRPKTRNKVIGVGQFASGVGDLASNKKHLEGYGK
jgi:hypothetical protein